MSKMESIGLAITITLVYKSVDELNPVIMTLNPNEIRSENSHRKYLAKLQMLLL